jgi:transposase
MKTALPELHRQREQILQEIQTIDRLRRGTLSEQFFVKKRGGKTTRQGPYYVLQCYLRGSKCSERIPADQAEKAKAEVANYQRFQELAAQFVEITDQITRLENGQTDAKKNSSRRRSPKNNSEKRGHS